MAFVDSMLAGFGEIGSSFSRDLSVLWLLIPLLLLWVLLEIYFDIYKSEELGWNTALGNGIALFWITADVMRALFANDPSDFWLRFAITMVVFLYAAMIIFFSFTHKISEKWDYIISSPTPIYFIAAITILWGYGVMQINGFVILDLLIIFVIILILKQIVKWIMPTKEGGLGDLGGGMGGEGLGGAGGGFGGGGALGDLGKEPAMPKVPEMPDMPKF